MTVLLKSIALNAVFATVLALIVWFVAMIPCVRRRPALRHFLWMIVLLKLVTPPLFELSVLPHWLTADAAPLTHPRAIPLGNLEDLTALSAAQSELLAPNLPPAAASGWHPDCMTVLLIVSSLGTVSILIIAIWQSWKLQRVLRGCASNDKRIDQVLQAAVQSMQFSRPLEVCVVEANISPLLWARRHRPLVVLPRRLLEQLSDDQLAYVVSHEIAHYLRRDHWTNFLSLMVTAVCWWNPVVWWARRELRTAQETCCDAMVISRELASRREYAETLFQTLEFIQAEDSLLPALASGFGSSSSMRRRFEMIANPLVNHRLSWWSYPVLVVALLALPCLPTSLEAHPPDVQTTLAQFVFDADGDGVEDLEFQNVTQNFEDLDRSDAAGYEGAGGYGGAIGAGAGMSGDYGSGSGVGMGAYDSDMYGFDASSYGAGMEMKQPAQQTYKIQKSEKGLVVLAFDLDSKKLAWSSEIELPQQANVESSQSFLLHVGEGVVTVAVVENVRNLKIQEIDAQSGGVTSEFQLVRRSKDSFGEKERKLLEARLREAQTKIEMLNQRVIEGKQETEQLLSRYERKLLELETLKQRQAAVAKDEEIARQQAEEERERAIDLLKKAELQKKQLYEEARKREMEAEKAANSRKNSGEAEREKANQIKANQILKELQRLIEKQWQNSPEQSSDPKGDSTDGYLTIESEEDRLTIGPPAGGGSGELPSDNPLIENQK